MTEEFNLSEKITRILGDEQHYHDVIYPSYVKEFIRRLKEELDSYSNISKTNIKILIDKLAGEKLC